MSQRKTATKKYLEKRSGEEMVSGITTELYEEK